MVPRYSAERNVQILVALMKAHGIKKIIISPGGSHVCFVRSVQCDPFFELYSAVDERSAAYIACGMAAESGEPVALSCTGATASRNYAPGLTEAFYRKLPVLAITSTQRLERIGHNIPQVIDRRAQMNDIVKLSVQLPMIFDDEGEWSVQLEANKALLALMHHGGGPVHINLVTMSNYNFSVQQLPNVSVINVIDKKSSFPQVPMGKIAIFVGSHCRWSQAVVDEVEEFCQRHDAIVIGDHTSNYHGKHWANVHLATHQREHLFAIDVDLLIHVGDVSGATITMLKTKEVWRVSEDGAIVDTFRKLRYVFEMSENDFFKRLNQQEQPQLKKDSSFLQVCKEEREKVLKNFPELPFSNIWIASQSSQRLPHGSVLHLGILSTLRSWNFFEIPEDVTAFSNVGGFGIDGSMSSLLGAALVSPDKLFFGIVGDLSFFYDMNVLGNRYFRPNIRLMLINNGMGAEFKLYSSIAQADEFGDKADPYIAAAGHNGNKSKVLVRHYAEDLGFEYLQADDKESYKLVMNRFFSPEPTERPVLLEVFVNDTSEKDAYYLLKHISLDSKEGEHS